MNPASPFTQEIWREIARGRLVTWQGCGVPYTYETYDFGKTHHRRRVTPDLDARPDASLGVNSHQIGPRLWLVHTLFCSPEAWWRHLAERPDAIAVPIFFHRGRLVVGPGLSADETICPTCAALRLAQAFPHPEVFISLLANPAYIAGPLDALRTLAGQEPLARFVVSYLDRLKAGELASFGTDDEHPQARWHRILPPPGAHPGHQVNETTARLFGVPESGWRAGGTDSPIRMCSTLTDSFVGPIVSTTKLVPEAEDPEDLHGYVTVTGHLGRFTQWHPDVSGSGLHFSQERAMWASVGEAVERYCGNFAPDTLVYASEDELASSGRPHVSQDRFRWFVSEQEASADWPFAPLRKDVSTPWVPGFAIDGPATGVLLPAEVVYLNLTRVTRRRPLYPVTLAGIAAHRSRSEAEAAALLELIERDATMLWWHCGLPARQLHGLPQALEERLGHGVPPHIRQWFLLLKTDMPAFVAAACLHDRKNEILVVGFAARASLADALHKSAAEAWQLRQLSRQLLDRGGALWWEIDAGRLPMPTRPFRADRRYVQEFRPDFTDMHQLAYNLQYYLDSSTHPPTLERLAGEPLLYGDVCIEWDDSPTTIVAHCAARLEWLGQGAYSVDLTTPDMRALDFIVVRVVCPGLVGNTPPAFVPLAHPRIERTLQQLGTRPYLGPMPHA